ncbi:hypothetical protein H4219_005338, partial [Mycoemilia scoparia]
LKSFVGLVFIVSVLVSVSSSTPLPGSGPNDGKDGLQTGNIAGPRVRPSKP